MNKLRYLIFALTSLTLSEAGAWTKTILANTAEVTESGGFPLLDEYGNTYPSLPVDYEPNVQYTSEGLTVLRLSWSDTQEPPLVGNDGFPVLGNYFRLNYGTLSSGGWFVSDMLTDYLTDIQQPTLVSRLDGKLSMAYSKGDVLTIETVETTGNVRVSLPIVADKWSVAIDENEGIHILSIRSNYELWHSYYDGESLSHSKLSDGPVSEAVASAGESNQCHVLYATFSEDMNFNEVLDDGEDLNGNAALDPTPYQLLYQSVDGSTANPTETVVNTIVRVSHIDLLYSKTYGLSLVYADPVLNLVRFAEQNASTWTVSTISSVSQVYADVRLTQKSNGDCAVSYVPEDGSGLYVSEETAGFWTPSLIAQSTTGAYFRGTDLAYDEDSNLVVLASEKHSAYLAAYSRSALPALMTTVVKPTSIRGAFVVTWPTPSEEADYQLLQSTTDLSDPDSWTTIEQLRVYPSDPDTIETIVERDSPSAFYRVIEISD